MPDDTERTRLTRRAALSGLAGGFAGLSGCSFFESGDGGASTAANRTDGATETATGTPKSTATPAGDLTVDVPDEVLIDEPFEPTLTGLVPFEDATLVAEAGDGSWRSEATFTAGGSGVADLGVQEPTGGSYGRPDPMGPVWSLEAQDGDGAFWSEAFWADPLGEHELAFSVESADRSVTERVTVRHADPAVTETDVDDGDLVAWWYEPPGDGPHPAALALHGSGGNPMRARSALLASRGVATLALQYFGAEGLPSSLAEVPLEYVQSAVDWVLARDAVGGERIGAYGVSRGGELALLLASVDDRIGAVVSDSGSHYVWGAVGTRGPAWTLDGEAVPYLQTRIGGTPTENEMGAPVYRQRFVDAVTDADGEQRRAAAVDVEDADAPILFLSGTDDQLWPSTMFGNALLARLDGTDYGRAYEHLAYRDAGHSIGYPYRPTTNRPGGGTYALGGTAAAHAAAQADGWPRVVEFLRSGLGE